MKDNRGQVMGILSRVCVKGPCTKSKKEVGRTGRAWERTGRRKGGCLPGTTPEKVPGPRPRTLREMDSLPIYG